MSLSVIQHHQSLLNTSLLGESHPFHACLQALAEKNAAIAESERCQRKLGLANRLIAALASEGDRWALTVQQLRKDYQVSALLHVLTFYHVKQSAVHVAV